MISNPFGLGDGEDGGGGGGGGGVGPWGGTPEPGPINAGAAYQACVSLLFSSFAFPNTVAHSPKRNGSMSERFFYFGRHVLTDRQYLIYSSARVKRSLGLDDAAIEKRCNKSQSQALC